MAIKVGPKIASDGIIFSADAANRKSNFQKTESSNILPDPNNWTTGSGGQSGYGANGGAAEQNRYETTTDPWGSRSIVWECTPDSSNNDDGGWNSSGYTVDSSYTYRWSVWIRRTATSGVGTVYLGLNPAPIRLDNNSSQGNPYFYYIGTGGITQNEWQLWTAHCFPYGYTGSGPHPDTGRWRTNGTYIGGLSGNVGNQDVKFPAVNGTWMHRTYLYYCTDTTQRVEFAYPRIDKCDGSEPTLTELIKSAPSRFGNLANEDISSGLIKFGGDTHPDYTTLGGADCFRFNSTSGGQFFETTSGVFTYNGNTLTLEAWIYPEAEVTSGDRGCIMRILGDNYAYLSWNKSNRKLSNYHYAASPSGYHETGAAMARNAWHHVVGVWNGTQLHQWTDGVKTSVSTTSSTTNLYGVEMGEEGAGRQFSGGIAQARVYNRALTDAEVLDNFNATKGKFGL